MLSLFTNCSTARKSCVYAGTLSSNVLVFRYGPEIYRHSNHWRELEQKSNDFYKTGVFINCSIPGHHACLDQFKADGNLQFNIDNVDP